MFHIYDVALRLNITPFGHHHWLWTSIYLAFPTLRHILRHSDTTDSILPGSHENCDYHTKKLSLQGSHKILIICLVIKSQMRA